MSAIAARGIDVSSHQGDIDFAKVKAAGYSFVIIKAGQGLRAMQTFRGKYLPAVLAAGLDWGAYWYSDAETADEARREAEVFVETLGGLKPTYPVWMDQEYASPCGKWGVGKGKQLRTDMVNAFCEMMQGAGYYTGLYASLSWLNQWVDCKQLSRWDKWVAAYLTEHPEAAAGESSGFAGAHGMWQHTVIGKTGTRCRDYWTTGLVPGLTENCDVNVAYKDYPSIIKAAGLNGWKAQQRPELPEGETTVPRAQYDALQARYDALAGRLDAIRKAGGWA